jgi:hypothetical protein
VADEAEEVTYRHLTVTDAVAHRLEAAEKLVDFLGFGLRRLANLVE